MRTLVQLNSLMGEQVMRCNVKQTDVISQQTVLLNFISHLKLYRYISKSQYISPSPISIYQKTQKKSLLASRTALRPHTISQGSTTPEVQHRGQRRQPSALFLQIQHQGQRPTIPHTSGTRSTAGGLNKEQAEQTRRAQPALLRLTRRHRFPSLKTSKATGTTAPLAFILP